MSSLRLGIMGMGYAGRQHLTAARAAGVTVVAVADGFLPAGLPAGVHPYKDWRELLGDANVDAVSICLPHHLHLPAAVAALEAGKHVLLEKPLARTAAEAQAIVRAAEKSGRTFMVGLTHRFYTPVVHARGMMQQGALGRLLAVEDRIIESLPPKFAGWLLQREFAGGGAGLTNGVHMLDRVAYVTGQSMTFDAGFAGRTQQLGDIEDTAAILLHLADNTPVQLLSQWRRGEARGLDDELTLYGTKGTLRVWAWRGWRFEPMEGEPREERCYDAKLALTEVACVAIGEVIAEFVRAVARGERLHPTVSGALDAQCLIEAFYETALHHE